ncbi:family 16 glycosylhydrolase [Burkholderia pyrrocinia]|uniref:family 16 glycosylhydrolase n=1 Tax=Burkholderia sp. IT-111MI5 TaxID=3026439 RepID=UPI002A31AC4A|nr:family 16 glycosylhydrolase [Burkholderia pyrrocinia]EKS9894265.1 family 16 glycosylhydrolase [Burkholderia pyrrocinia]EKS9906277.1 family 16 glycosylhydrolase [Burkholderia pyrrocinia]
MNLSKPLRTIQRIFYSAYLQARFLLPRQRCISFAYSDTAIEHGIGRIYVINLDREAARWAAITRELKHVRNASGQSLAESATRFAAIDARKFREDGHSKAEISGQYTLADQLFVEPQPDAMPDKLELERPIQMSPAEIAVARSHIGVWKSIADGTDSFALVLEDDVWFHRHFAGDLDKAWAEMQLADGGAPQFDLLYVSFKEVKHGARKQFVSQSVFRPERGLWYFSGYVLSRRGAAKLLDLLPCRGPVDLWINHQFDKLDVRAIRHSRIGQRLDFNSANSYSILPSLAKIGVIDSEGASLFHGAPREQPVFAFCAEGTGASSLAMALSMLGYRCCSDLDEIPQEELTHLIAGSTDRVFNAYVNIGSLTKHIEVLRKRFPQAKFIVIVGETEIPSTATLGILESLDGSDVVQLCAETSKTWNVLCEHLRCAPPVDAYPRLVDVGQQALVKEFSTARIGRFGKEQLWDRSPWVIQPRRDWHGIRCRPPTALQPAKMPRLTIRDNLQFIDAELWEIRDDTFPGNLGLFRPQNVVLRRESGVSLVVKPEPLKVRNFSAAALSSRQRFQFGRFEIEMRATGVPGLVTGFFLHRDSPRQEIDIEIVGNRPDQLLANVFYNPGQEGSKFDYGYRGAPTIIPLGFDASDALHEYAIEWDPWEIRWFVDNRLVHSRGNWNPTPIPHLPMTLHVNTWPTRSRELAGHLLQRALPTASAIRSISVDACLAETDQLADQPLESPLT